MKGAPTYMSVSNRSSNVFILTPLLMATKNSFAERREEGNLRECGPKPKHNFRFGEWKRWRPNNLQQRERERERDSVRAKGGSFVAFPRGNADRDRPAERPTNR